MPRSGLRRKPQPRFLTHPVLHPERLAGDPVVDIFLDQRRCSRRPRQHRPAHCPHAHHPVNGVGRPTASGLLHQGDRRLDVDVPRLRLRIAHRVCSRQRLVETRSTQVTRTPTARSRSSTMLQDTRRNSTATGRVSLSLSLRLPGGGV